MRHTCTKRRACHTQAPSMTPKAPLATQKTVASLATKRATRASPVSRRACHTKTSSMPPHAAQGITGDQARHQTQPCRIWAPRFPHKSDVRVTKCHACHAKVTPMSPNAMPATQKWPRCHQMPCLPHKVLRCDQVARDKVVGMCYLWKSCVCVWQSCAKIVCVCERGVCDNFVCDSVVWQCCARVTELCVWQSCMWKKCVCVWKSCVCDKVGGVGGYKVACDNGLCARKIWQLCVCKKYVWQWRVCVCETVVCMCVCDNVVCVCVCKSCVCAWQRCVCDNDVRVCVFTTLRVWKCWAYDKLLCDQVVCERNACVCDRPGGPGRSADGSAQQKNYASIDTR